MRRWIPIFVLVAVFGSMNPAAAQSELDLARDRAEAAAVAADDARDAAAAAQARADALAKGVEDANHAAEDVDSAITAVLVRATAAEQEAEGLRDVVGELLVQRYVFGEQRGTDFGASASFDTQATAGALARFATLGVGDEVDRYRIVTDDLDAVNRELVALRAELETALDLLRVNETQMLVELTEIGEQLRIADEREAEFQVEVARLEEEERQRIEAERRRREAERRRLEAERRAAAEAEAARLAEERRVAEEQAALTSTTTTTTTTTAPTATTDGAAGDSPDSTVPGAEGGASDASETTTTTIEPVITGSNGFLCPIGGPTTFSDTWGAARSGGRSHKGVDMFATRGTPVVASVGGEVRQRNSRLGGLSYYLDGDDGNRYYGAHLDSFGASGRVEAGTVIGTVGNSGNARFSSPHLHFEVMPGGGRAVNPTPTVRAACG